MASVSLQKKNNSTPAPTSFLPAERLQRQEVLAQARDLVDDPLLRSIVDSSKGFIAVLNAERQVIFANRSLTSAFDLDLESALGFRPGEIASCVEATAPGGCGTAPACATCGVAIAIQSAQTGEVREEECRIVRHNGDPIDLEVTVTPFLVNGDEFSLFTALDISDRKRRRALERVFFHDILNSATGIRGLSAAARDVSDAERDELLELIEAASEQMIGEIQGQRDLLAAETNELAVEYVDTDSTAIAVSVIGAYASHPIAENKNLILADQSEGAAFATDPSLLRRVLSNLVKNALEATAPGGTVTLGCHANETSISFTTHNESEIPRSHQLQIFKRSFTTKGAGRGLGTYGARLLSERYLGGTIRFESSPETGTTFTATYPLSPPTTSGSITATHH